MTWKTSIASGMNQKTKTNRHVTTWLEFANESKLGTGGSGESGRRTEVGNREYEYEQGSR